VSYVKKEDESWKLQPITCVKCITLNPPGGKYCCACGQDLPQGDGRPTEAEALVTAVLTNPAALRELIRRLEKMKAEGEEIRVYK